METNNETVEQICEEIRGSCDIYDLSFSVCDGLGLADRILSAHKREIEAKDDERLTIVANYESVIAAKDRIIAAKDAASASARGFQRQRKNLPLSGSRDSVPPPVPATLARKTQFVSVP